MNIHLDSIYALPPLQMFAVVTAAVGVIAVALDTMFLLPRIRDARHTMTKMTTAVVTVSGGIFGLAMSFLANSVWTTEDHARDAVYDEARAIEVVDIYLDYATGPARDGILRIVNDYGKAVAAEWDSMGETSGAEAEQELRNIYAAVIKGFAEGDQNRMLQQRLLMSLDSISSARQRRLSIAQNRISPSQWILMTGLGIVVLATVAVSHAAFPMVRRIALAAISLAVALMLFVIILHDRPFVGYASVTPDPILWATGNVR